MKTIIQISAADFANQLNSHLGQQIRGVREMPEWTGGDALYKAVQGEQRGFLAGFLAIINIGLAQTGMEIKIMDRETTQAFVAVPVDRV